MASYNELLALIDAYINQNGVQAITGQVLNGVLRAMVDQLGRGYSIMGAADPTTDPGTPDGPETWFASVPGTYTNFDGIQIVDGELALLSYVPSTGFSKNTIYEGFQTVQATIDGNVGTPAVGVSYANGILSFDFHNMKGVTGDPAGFGAVTASVDSNIGTPSVQVQTSGPDTAKAIAFQFHNLKGETGVTSVLATVDNTSGNPQCAVSLNGQQLVLNFTGLKGAQGDTGSSVDYPFTIVNNLTTNDATQALSAAQGVVLDGKVSQLEAEVTELKDAVDTIADLTIEQNTETVQVPVTISNGRFDSNGNYVAENTRRSTNKISVVPGEKYLISVNIGTSTAIAYLGQWNGNTFVGIPNDFAAGTGNAVDREYIVPVGVDTIALSSYNTTAPSLKQVVSTVVAKAYTKDESNTLFSGKVDKIDGKGLSTNDFTNADKEKLDNLTGGGKFGVKWSLSDYSDLGTRVFDAEEKTATIGRGTTDGQSDFDSILPWSGMKRCNIKTNANGANIVTFEGETGFALDGSNGDVFVRIPKFKANHYKEDGYEYLVIGDGYVHPAFIENGVELDEIFIGAYEASGNSTELFSKGGVIPANNITPQGFLDGAQAKGRCFSLYDMRCVDALWMLMAVEFGCRNSNRIIGYGIADYLQPVFWGRGVCLESATNTNSIKVGYFNAAYKLMMPVGGNITVCGNQDQKTILTQAKITGVTDGPNNEYTIFTFDGPAIDVDTNCFVGSAPFNTNFIDTCANPLSWHTGRGLAVVGGEQEITRNPVRYRWVENPVGNLWHYLPDVTFNDLQMYVCKDMTEYVMQKYTAPYYPVGPVLPGQTDNGSKGDVNTSESPNFWITSLLNDIFAKGNCFGKSFDTVHDGSLLSTNGFGGYYYLSSGTRIIANGGGFDHLYRCNLLTNRAWESSTSQWYLYGARLMFKNI